MATVDDLIKSSLRLGGIIGEGEVPTNAMMQDSLATLNDLVGQLNNDGLMLYGSPNDVVALTAGQSSYTVGIGGNFNITRPQSIDAAYVDYQGVSFQIYETTQEEYNLITLKAQQQVLPRFYVYLNSYPLGTMLLWPVPSQVLTLTLTSSIVIPSFVLSDVLSLPPGYSKALRFSLLCDLCPQYGREPSKMVMDSARSAMAEIKRTNRTTAMASFDPAIVGGGIAGFMSGY